MVVTSHDSKTTGADTIDPKTLEILAALAQGFTEQDVADMCDISGRTFRRRMQHIRRDWNVGTNIEAVVHAVRTELL